MIDTRCFENGHITSEAFQLLESEVLSNDDRLALSGHLASCNSCTTRYLDFLTEDLLIDAPDGLQDKIIKNTIATNIKPKAYGFRYVQILKLTAAAVLAISFYSAGIFNYFYNTSYSISSNIPQNKELARFDDVGIGDRINNEFSKFTDKFDRINKFNGDGLYEKK